MNGTCQSTSFRALLGTHFINALCDNLFKTVVSFYAMSLFLNVSKATQFVSIVTILFIVPFIFLSPVGGYLADRFPKRNVIISLFGIKILMMLGAVLALYQGSLAALALMVALLEINTALYVPARLSILVDILAKTELPKGNGYIQMASLLGIILGTSMGGWLFEQFRHQAYHIGIVMTVLMTGTFIASFWIKTDKGNFLHKEINIVLEMASASKGICRHHGLLMTLSVLIFFNFIGAIFQTNVLVWGAYVLHATETQSSLLLLSLSLGLAVGSVWAGSSSQKIDLHLVPLGGVGISLMTLLLGLNSNYCLVTGFLFFLGISGGFFLVQPQAFFEYYSPAPERGMYISILEVVTAAGYFLAGGFLWVIGGKMSVKPDQTFIITSVMTILATIWIFNENKKINREPA